jgi:hypothetical protein
MTAIGGGYCTLRRCTKPSGHRVVMRGPFQVEGCDFGPRDYEAEPIFTPGDARPEEYPERVVVEGGAT